MSTNQSQQKMTTIREYIRHHKEYQREKANLTARPRLGQSIPANTNRDMHRSQKTAQYPSPLFNNKKMSLPPISELIPKNRHFSLQLKRSQAISQYFQAKHQSIVSKKRLKTQSSSRKNNPSRSTISINLEQMRMKPLDKYFYKMENIRLAERLLVVKPSPEVQRQKQKKFFKQQKVYSTRLSRNYSSQKKHHFSIKKSRIAQKGWVN